MEEVRDRIVGIGLSNFLPELDKFFGCIAVYREPQRTSIVDFASLGFGGCRSPEVIDVMQSYFDDVAGTLFEGFWQEHMKTQYLCAAAGAAVLDRTSLESLPGTGWLTIFWGFALFAGNGMISFITEEGHRKGSIAVRVHSAGIDLNEAERRVELELKEQLGPGSHKVFLSLENFARLVARSRELQNRGYVEESFTLLMVALESILANRDSISSTLSQRVGVIWAVSQDKQFKDSIRLIQSLYDARSKFVHQGQPIAQNLLDVLSEVCRAVFFAAYRSQARSTNSQEEAWKDRWFSLLDYLSACFDIGVSVDPGVASIAGVLKSPSVTAKAPI
jgi:hypothetical protein